MKPKISVITVVFNSEALIERTIKSVLSQTYSNIEYSIIDGKSIDQTVDIIHRYRDAIDVFVSEEDKGIYDAMNKGIHRSSGEWLFFLNAGDTFFDEHTVDLLVSHLDDNTDILYGDIVIVDENLSNKEYASAGGLTNIWSTPPCWHQAMLIKAAWQKQNLYNIRYTLGADYDFMLKSFVNNVKFKYLSKPFAYFLRGGLSTGKIFLNRLECTISLSTYIPYLENMRDNFFFKDMINIYNEDFFQGTALSKKIGTMTQKLATLKAKYRKIALYGFGNTGQLIAPYLGDHLTLIVDKKIENIKIDKSLCILEDLYKHDFDCIIISLIGREYSVACDLVHNFNVPQTKIYTLVGDIPDVKNLFQDNKKEMKFESGICTQEQLESKTYQDWVKYFKLESNQLHRKIWEYCFIAETLKKYDLLREGMQGLGFAVGTEPLPATFCSLGARITATDLNFDEADKMGWVNTNQHAKNLENLNTKNICSPHNFLKLCRFQNVNMNNIPEDLRDFDFIWSACALEHLGSLKHGEEFIYNSLKCLKPGGIAVHTTEYNFSSNDRTVECGPTVLYRRKDIESIVAKLRSDGHSVSEINFSSGALEGDTYIDLPPYNRNNKHLKLVMDEFVITSIGLVIQKKSQ